MDETYYWMWGQHPALSYFDHPPLIAWTQGLSAAIFGWNKLALRLPVVLTLVADLGMLYLFAKRLGGGAWREWFWLSALLLATTPVFVLMSSVALPDHLMIALLLVALYCLQGVLIAHDEGRRDRRMLYLGALALGLALLAKYYVVLFGLGVVIFLAGSRYRALFRDPHLWLAMVLAVAMQAPVLAWNATHDFASFQFITSGRMTIQDPLSFRGLIGYVLGILAMLSPFLVWPSFRFALGRGGSAGLARTIFWVSTLAFLAASFRTNILVHWNLIAYVAALPFLAGYLRSRIVLIGHLVFGTLIIALAGINYAIVPVGVFVNPYADQTSSWSHGWDEVAARMEAAKKGRDVGFIATPAYETAGPLGYALRDRDVTSLASRTDAFDDWFDAGAHAGQSALILGDRWRVLGDDVRAHFDHVEEIDRFEVFRAGRAIDEFVIYYATGLHAVAAPAVQPRRARSSSVRARGGWRAPPPMPRRDAPSRRIRGG
jgi:hypothetical protein